MTKFRKAIKVLFAIHLVTMLSARFVVGPFSEANWFTYELVHNSILLFIPSALLLFLVSLLTKTWRRISLAVIPLAWLLFADPVVRLPNSQPQRGDLKLITYNIAHGEINADGVIQELKNANADIICLQESGRPGTKEASMSAQEIAQKLGYAFWVQKPDNSIISRYPMELQHIIDVPTKWSKKQFPEVLIATPKGKVRVVSIHLEPSWVTGWPPDLRNFRPIVSKVVRDRRTQVAMLLDRVHASKEPIILAGDFNAPPYTEVPHRLRAELTDSFAATGSGCGMTLLAAFPYQRIDYAFVRGLKPTRAEVIKSLASDHCPVVFEYALPSE